ncbi:calcium-dependent protein kinase 8-like isoform X2 [Trifolium pratense]|uniref:calcium-dependent protein kinase 8-like isoform X2 n=1 Tax=Trifolium pratense TaxID=57577 RepID=UPI001E690FA3|nr:calcium-dependent protein kinase 8-like isoform X2 [Trifolium pratense]
MENCSTNLCGLFKNKKRKDWPEKINNINTNKLVVLKEPTGREIGLRYELGRELGRGEFGITYLCKDRQTGEELACKSISKNKLRKAIDIEDLRRQVEIMRHLPIHPNIVTLKYTYEDEDDVHLVMELCGGDDLLHRIVSEGYYTERSAASVIKTAVQVVQMCHKHGVMHRNLKLENFLFADKTETGPLKIADFHLSIFFQPGERLNQMVGSSYYMAPEVLKRRNYGPEIDIWSAGVILYFLLCGFPPFWAETEKRVSQAIIDYAVDFKRDPWPHVSDNAKDLVKKMLDPNPERRLTAQEVLDHPWLINVVKKKPDKANDLVKNMLAAHDVLGHPWLQNPNTAPNVSLGETVRRKLLQFSVMNKLTKTTSRVIAQHLYDEEVWAMETGTKDCSISSEVWAMDTSRVIAQHLYDEEVWAMDTGTKDCVNHDEVRRRLHRLGQQNPDVDVQRLVDDFHGFRDDGYLDYGRFLDISVHLRKRSHEEHVDTAFQFFDKQQSGYIQLEDLSKALAETDKSDTTSQKVIYAIMHDLATNKDGRISYEEITNRSLILMNDWSSELIND